ncbi:MAG TPA: DUF1338 family protein [Bacteroidales bacterium]|nr:DUF1338 family protein [Bacteroidales bacterium]
MFTYDGEEVLNDHIVFRTLNDPHRNIELLFRLFIAAGYVEKDQSEFKGKKTFCQTL